MALMIADLRIAPFRFDVTPPLGHACCGGWIKPVQVIDDPLEAIGYVLLGSGTPIVVCAVDWLGISNDAHVGWRTVLAEAAGTVSDRVAIHTVHQHNAPLVCLEAAHLVAEQADLPPVFEIDFFRSCLDRGRSAVKAALLHSRPITHVGRGEGRVDQVASNRRVARDADGNVIAMRTTRCTNPALIALPEGSIDPMLKTIAYYEGETKIVSCHYYATHPMSYYADGRVTSDFCGLARRQRQEEEPRCTHIYFNGCGANIGAGKYNDGSPAARKRLTSRMYEGIVASEADLRRERLVRVEWRTRETGLDPNPVLVEDDLKWAIMAKMDGSDGPKSNFGDRRSRILSAFKLAWLDRCRRQVPIGLSSLHLNDISIVHLPGEVFIEYQLRAQQMRPDRFVAVAAYGDDGPFYIPTREEYRYGGYEVNTAFVAESADEILTEGIKDLLG